MFNLISDLYHLLEHARILDRYETACHAIIGPGQKWSPGLFLAAQRGPAGQVLVAKSGPPLPITGPRELEDDAWHHFWHAKTSPRYL